MKEHKLPQTLNEWVADAHRISLDHGWYDVDNRTFGDFCQLFVSEISEAYEAYRHGADVRATWIDANGKPEGIPVELVDCLIRLFDWFGQNGLDLQAIATTKHTYNKQRPYRHGNKVT